ncbi:hypothetical protein ABPG75_013396 [Micractinium tetrahymenae]
MTSMLSTPQAGLVFAALSAVFNGSFGVFTKLRKARAVSPLILNYWMAEGVGISGLLLLALPNRVLTWWGVLSGVLFVASSGHAVTAISLVGLAAATGVWCGTAVLVSFAWGVTVAGDEVAHMGLAAAALALILAGIAGIVASAAGGGAGGQPGETPYMTPAEIPRGPERTEEGVGESLLPNNSHAPAEPAPPRWQDRLSPASRIPLGLLAAVLAGAIGGLILAPMLAAPKEARGVQFVPSMAAGALLVAPLVTAVLTRAGSSISFTQATSSRAAAPGMAAGATWNVGNCLQILAVTNPRVGLAVAMPIMQCGLFVAGLWGIFLFREVRGARMLALYWASGLTLVIGAALLAAAKGDS